MAKGVQLSHAYCAHYAETGIAMRRLGPADGVYAFSPLFHVDGLFANVLAPLVVGRGSRSRVAVDAPVLAHLPGPPTDHFLYYRAALTFVLRGGPDGWQISRFHETVLPE